MYASHVGIHININICHEGIRAMCVNMYIQYVIIYLFLICPQSNKKIFVMYAHN